MNVQQRLAELVAIPGVSAKSFPQEEVHRSAAAVAETLVEYGLTNVRLLDHSAVYGEFRGDGPTVLVYGHHDVQPPGNLDRWLSPPFEATVRNGRIYGRGTSDDKGGFLAYLEALGDGMPCNVKLLIEGEEEIGSPNLGRLLDEHRDLFGCDYIVLCDTPNFATGVPSLTYRLRGNCLIDVEVRCLRRPLHSGQAGGLAPDAILILCTLLARLQDRVPGLEERVRVDEAQLAAMRALPFDAAQFELLDGVQLISEGAWESIWARPSITITAIEAVPVARAANQISDSARARISLRTVRDLDTREAGALVANVLRANPPHGAQVTVDVLGGPSWWEADPAHPLFAAARRALSRAFGREAVMMGSGGSIGFVKPFAGLARGASRQGIRPPLLTGVQDPHSNAHSENESLHLGDWHKAMAAARYLFHELAELPC